MAAGSEGQSRVADKVLVEVVALGRYENGHEVRRRLAHGRQKQEASMQQCCQGELETNISINFKASNINLR